MNTEIGSKSPLTQEELNSYKNYDENAKRQ